MKTAKGVLIGRRLRRSHVADGRSSSAAPFEKIPLVYERAFGGPQVPANPVGVGHKGAAGPDGKKRLPNFETPGKLIRSPGDTPPVAGLGAIHPVWKPRWDLVGTYDKAWFKTRWPYYPVDFNYAFFQAAPEGQRLPKVNGDEEFELVGMHADRGAFGGRLPCVAPRASSCAEDPR